MLINEQQIINCELIANYLYLFLGLMSKFFELKYLMKINKFSLNFTCTTYIYKFICI